MDFKKKLHPQTPGMHTIAPTLETEIAYWYLRNKRVTFTSRQVESKPSVFSMGDDPRAYDHLKQLMPQNKVDVDNNAIPNSMRLGLILEALAYGCENETLILVIKDELEDKRSMVNQWLGVLDNLRSE